MANHDSLRSISVESKTYYWKVRNRYDAYEGVLRIFSSQHKSGFLEIYFTFAQLAEVFPKGAIYKWTRKTGLPVIGRPLLVVQIVRYAKKQLNWKPMPRTAPTIIQNGYELLRQVGYEPIPHSR